jgi:hypothetical protein
MQKVEFVFFTKSPKPADIGLKFVIWEILIPPVATEEPTIKHDWGFAEWSGEKWEDLPGLPEGWAAVVVRWANTKNPAELLEPRSKIVLLN